jgi:hypothetical protein
MRGRARTLPVMCRDRAQPFRIVLAMVVLAACNLSASARPFATTVNVRLFNNFGVLRDDLTVALTEARVVFLDADVDIVWRDCSQGQGPLPASCGNVPASNEVLLRLVASPTPPPPQRVSLGSSLVDLEGAHGVLATVFPDRVRLVARAAAVDERQVLGHVIAHEIGHLLLGVGTHAERGLMRGFWSRRSLQQPIAGDWRFSERESASMRSGLLARLLTEDSRQIAGNVDGCSRVPELSSPACAGSFGGISTGSSGLR